MKVFSCLKMCQINSEGRADFVETHSKIFFNRCIFDQHKTLILQLEKGILMGRDRERETRKERETHREGERERHTEKERETHTHRRRERHTQTDRERGTEGERDTHRRRERETHTEGERDTLKERDWFEMIISTFDIF